MDGAHAPHGLRGEPVLEAEAELGVELAGLHVAVGGGLDAGRDPDQDILRSGSSSRSARSISSKESSTR